MTIRVGRFAGVAYRAVLQGVAAVASLFAMAGWWAEARHIDEEAHALGLPPAFRHALLRRWAAGWLETTLRYPGAARALVARARETAAGFVYLSALTYPDLVTEAMALKEALSGGGALVTLGVERMGGPDCRRMFRQVFDVRGNLCLLGRVLAAIHARVAVVRNTGGTFWALPVFLGKVRAPIVYRPSGFITQTTDEAHERTFGPLADAARRLEAAVVSRAALVLHNNDEAAIRCLGKVLGVGPVRHLPVRSGPHPAVARRHEAQPRLPSGEPGVVYCGGYVPPGSYLSSNVDYLRYWRRLTEAGIHVHVYYSHTPRRAPALAPVRDALDGHPYFHLYDPIPVLELFERLGAYDFVWAYFARPIHYVRPEFRRFVSANTCLALAAGLPAIVNEHYEPLYSIVREHGNGLALPSGLDAELPALLKAADRAAMRRAAVARRADFYFPLEAVVRTVTDVLAPTRPAAAAVLP